MSSKIPLLHKTQQHLKKRLTPSSNPILFLNITQFLAALNDNLFKLFIIFLLIGTLGKAEANTILSAAGAIFVIPFILFSASAGILADRFSKQRFMVIMKVVEIIVMFLALFAFSYKSVWGCYSLLFALATHSALFGPPKYSIIPELVTTEMVPKANGIITSFTYIAIILGTFLASFITEMSGRNFLFAASFCLLIAFCGLLASLRIPYTKPQGSTKKLSFLFITDIYRTLCFAKTREHLIYSISGSAFFLFIGAFTQLNIIPFAIQSLNMNEVAGGYLFLSTAIGIAIGSIIAGKLSRKKLELGLSCVAGVIISLAFFLLNIFSTDLYVVVSLLVVLGIAGGLFIVPFDSFTQVSSPDEKRGQVIGAANFLSFVGVLFAAIVLYLFGNVWKLSSAEGFSTMGLLTLAFSVFLFFKLSDHFFSYLAGFLRLFYKVEYPKQHIGENAIFFMDNPSLFKVIILHRYLTRPVFFWLKNNGGALFSLSKLGYSFHLFPKNKENLKGSFSQPICLLGDKESRQKHHIDKKVHSLVFTKHKKMFFLRTVITIKMEE